MDSLVNVVDSLENKIYILLQRLDEANKLNQQLLNRIDTATIENEELQKAVKNWEDKYNSLKIANSMLGSIQDKNEAKLKINTLIREIDECIIQLSE